jgi:hypothetical protein
MDPLNNPYTPNAGAPPAALLGRGVAIRSLRAVPQGEVG